MTSKSATCLPGPLVPYWNSRYAYGTVNSLCGTVCTGYGLLRGTRTIGKLGVSASDEGLLCVSSKLRGSEGVNSNVNYNLRLFIALQNHGYVRSLSHRAGLLY